MRSDYHDAKRLRGVLDYDDLIVETRNLLHKRGAAQWVLYKLDGGIDHVLIDEAQDTSPEQWEIVQKLTEEFFAGMGRERGQLRTIFAVGDEKQSIFSFQGADPDPVRHQPPAFRGSDRGAGAASARSAADHLAPLGAGNPAFVDKVFESEAARAGLTVQRRRRSSTAPIATPPRAASNSGRPWCPRTKKRSITMPRSMRCRRKAPSPGWRRRSPTRSPAG